MRMYFKLIMSLAMFSLFFSAVRLSLLPDSVHTHTTLKAMLVLSFMLHCQNIHELWAVGLVPAVHRVNSPRTLWVRVRQPRRRCGRFGGEKYNCPAGSWNPVILRFYMLLLLLILLLLLLLSSSFYHHCLLYAGYPYTYSRDKPCPYGIHCCSYSVFVVYGASISSSCFGSFVLSR